MSEDPAKEPEKRTCAVCARVLDAYEIDGEVTWGHTLAGADDDHPAVPVEPDEVQTKYRCDFCNEDEPKWVVPVRPFPVPDQPGVMSGENWSACEGCGHLIELNQWTALLRRVAESWERRHGLPMLPEVKTGLSSVYRVLRKNITGSMRPVEKPGS